MLISYISTKTSYHTKKTEREEQVYHLQKENTGKSLAAVL